MTNQTFHYYKQTSKTRRLAIMFSILFVSLIFVTMMLTQEKVFVNGESSNTPFTKSFEHSNMTVSLSESINAHSQKDVESGHSKVKDQSGTSSSISNYVNAWRLSKVTPAFQIIT